MYSQLTLNWVQNYAYGSSHASNTRGRGNEEGQRERDSGLNQLQVKYVICTHFTTRVTWGQVAGAPCRPLEGDCANDRLGGWSFSRFTASPPPAGAQGNSEAVSRSRGNACWQAKAVAVYYSHLACILSINSIFSPMNKYVFYKRFLLPSMLITLVSAFAMLCLEDPLPHHDQVIPISWSPAQLLSFLGSSPCPRAFKIGSLLH